jgi:hypothetical protein
MSITQKVPSAGPSLTLDFANSKKLDSRFIFTRSGAATYVDSNGLIKTAITNEPRFNHKSVVITNLIKRSENFDDGGYWATDNSGLTITANGITSPSSSLTSDTLTEANTNTIHNRYQNVGLLSTSSPYTFSVYVKPNTVTRVRLGLGYAGLGGGGYAIFNLSSGTVISTTASAVDPGSNLSATIVPVYNGWYRCSFTVTPARSDLAYFASIALINSSNADVYQGNTANNLYVWGAQLEKGSSASDYLPNPTTSSKTETKVESLGLTIEGASTNLIDYSEFTAGSWASGLSQDTGYIALYTPNTTETLDPKGTNTAAKVYQNGTGWQRILKGIATPDGVTKPHTWSIFVKRGNSDICVIEHTGLWTQGGRVKWNFATETFTTQVNFGNYRFERYPNGWYRISATFVPGSTTGAAWIFPGNDINGASVGAFTYVWGYQLEPIEHGSVITTNADKIALGAPTSYIYCNGTATTRNADSCYAFLYPEFNYYEHTTIAKATFNSYPVLGFQNRTTHSFPGNGFIWSVWWETGPRVYGFLQYAIYNEYNTTNSSEQINTGDTAVLASSLKLNDISVVYANNKSYSGATGINNSSSVPRYLEVGSFGSFHHLNGSIAKISYYPRRVSNIELREAK